MSGFALRSWCSGRAALLAIILGVAECGCGSGADRSPDVLLVCLDTVRADHLGCYAYGRPTSPHLDALAARSIRFADASAAASWTKPSVPSFLTGTWPLEHGVYEGSARTQQGDVTDILPESARTLAETFALSGYATAAFVHNSHLKRGNGLEQGFEQYEEGDFDARELRWRAQDWIDERSDDRPFFLYVHILDAHFPCPVPDDFARMFAAGADLALFRGDSWRGVRDDVNDGRRTLSKDERDSLEALYDGAIRYIDDQFGRLLAFLERRERTRELVVSVIADHGEEFLEHNRIGHGHDLYENLLRVPWLLRAPGHAAEQVDEAVSLVDLYPTLLAAAGLEAPPPGRGVNRLSKPFVPTPLFAEHKDPDAYLQSWREGSWKLIRRFEPPAAGRAAPAEFELPSVGSRFEATIDATSTEHPVAIQLAPRGDAASDPFELKGLVERRESGKLRVAGVEVHVTPETELYGDLPKRDGQAARWEDGVPLERTMVKVLATPSADGFTAQRMKLYGPEERIECAIRGAVTAAEGTRERGRLRIGTIWIGWNAATTWSSRIDAQVPTLSREDIATIAELGAEEAARLGYRVETRLFDLAADPHEMAPSADVQRTSLLGTQLDAFAARLARNRIWSANDRAVLSSETMQALRGLGYVR